MWNSHRKTSRFGGEEEEREALEVAWREFIPS
jgi:hypothetical protein